MTIELAKPLEWVRVEKDEDLSRLMDMRDYAIRKDGRDFIGYLNRVSEAVGIGNFEVIGESDNYGPSGHFPFEVALIETPPWPIVHKDANGWIDLGKTPVELLESGDYELRGDWEGSAWGWWRTDHKRWEVSHACRYDKMPPPFDNPTKARRVESLEVPKDWINGPPKQPETREERLEKKVKELEARLAKASAALGEGGVE